MPFLGRYRYRRETHPFFDGPLPLLSAHRGASGTRPEATEIAYRHALELEADILEADVHLTADGVPVLSHDPYVGRITQGQGLIAEYTLENLKKLNVGYHFSPDDGDTYPYRQPGRELEMLTLEEAFEKFPQARFTIDIKENKPELIDRVFELVKRFDRADITLLTSFSADVMDQVHRRIRETGVHVATSASEKDVLQCVVTAKLGLMIPPKDVMSLFVPPTKGMDLGYRFPAIITPGFNQQAHALNIPVIVWTTDDPLRMAMLLDAGVDGIVTNYPARLHPYVRGKRDEIAIAARQAPKP